LKFKDELKIDSAIWHDSHLNLKGQIILYREIVDKGGLLMRDPFNDNNIYKTLDEVKDQ
jgi:hypothetical protein